MSLRGFHQRLVSLAGARRMGASDLARALTRQGVHTSQSYVSRMFSGERDNPSAELVGALSDVLEVPVTYWYESEVAERILDNLRR